MVAGIDVVTVTQGPVKERARKSELLCTEAISLLVRLVRLQDDGGLEYDAFNRSYCLFCFVDAGGEHEEDCLYRCAVRFLREAGEL